MSAPKITDHSMRVEYCSQSSFMFLNSNKYVYFCKIQEEYFHEKTKNWISSEAGHAEKKAALAESYKGIKEAVKPGRN